MPLPVLRLMRLMQRWLGWEWAVLVVRRDDDVQAVKLPEELPVSVRENTDGSVGMTIGHDDDGEALLADLRALMGGACSPVQSEMTHKNEAGWSGKADRYSVLAEESYLMGFWFGLKF